MVLILAQNVASLGTVVSFGNLFHNIRLYFTVILKRFMLCNLRCELCHQHGMISVKCIPGQCPCFDFFDTKEFSSRIGPLILFIYSVKSTHNKLDKEITLFQKQANPDGWRWP